MVWEKEAQHKTDSARRRKNRLRINQIRFGKNKLNIKHIWFGKNRLNIKQRFGSKKKKIGSGKTVFGKEARLETFLIMKKLA